MLLGRTQGEGVLSGGTLRAIAGPGGWLRGPPRQPPFGRVAQAAFAIFILTVVTLNVVGRIESRPGSGGLSSAQIVFDEATSAIVSIPLILLFWPVLREIYRRQLTMPVRMGSLVAAGVASSLLHVAGFKLLRILAGPVLGIACSCSLFEKFGFELAKDTTFYALMVGGLFAAPVSLRRAIFDAPAPPPTAPAKSTPPLLNRDLIDLPNGRHRLRVRTSEIVAVVSAGNYAEFRLLDGRRPLLRTTLAALEAQLSDRGLRRVHRSWIVNPDHVRNIRSLPSGDSRLTLANGEVAPASRRYADGMNGVLGAGETLGAKTP